MISKREYPTLPIIGVGILIQKDNKYLLLKRASEPEKGLWSVPGGLIEVGERVTEAAVREASEETGLVVEVKKRLGIFDKIKYDEEGKVLYHYIIIHFLAYPVEGELKPMNNALDAIWISKDQLKNYKITKSFKQFTQSIGLYID